jgi:hypothetical protein
LIRYIMNRESFITTNKCKTQDVINSYNTITNSASSLNKEFIDQKTLSDYNDALSAFTAAYNAIPDCSVSCVGGTVNSAGFCVCPATAPVPTLINGNIVCAQNDNTVYNCIPGTTYTTSKCINGQSTRTRSGDIQPLNGGLACPPVNDGVGVACSDCISKKSTIAIDATKNKYTLHNTIIPAFGGGTCNLQTASPDSVVLCNNNNCDMILSQTITQSGTYSIPPNVTGMTITIIGGGGGSSMPAPGTGTAQQMARLPGCFGYAGHGLAGSTQTYQFNTYNFNSFSVAIGDGGKGYDSRKGVECIDNSGGPTSFSLGSFAKTAIGGGGATRLTQTAPPGGSFQPYTSASQTGYSYGDGGDVYTPASTNYYYALNIMPSYNRSTDGSNGAVIIKYKYNTTIPQTIADNGYIDITYTSPGIFPIPPNTNYIAVLAAGGGGGGWYGGVLNRDPLPVGYPKPRIGDINMYGPPPGAGGAASPSFILSGTPYIYTPQLTPQFKFDGYLFEVGSYSPRIVQAFSSMPELAPFVASNGYITIAEIGRGGNGASKGGTASDGTATLFRLSSGSTRYESVNSTYYIQGGKAATGPMIPGSGFGANNYISTSGILGISGGGGMPGSCTVPGNPGTTRSKVDPNGVILTTVTNQESNTYNIDATAGSNGGAFSYSDTYLGANKIFGSSTSSLYDYNDPSGSVSLKNGLPGCGGRGGDSYIYDPDGKDKGVDPSTLSGSPGGKGGDGFVRLIFLKGTTLPS